MMHGQTQIKLTHVPFPEDFILPCFLSSLSVFHLPVPKDNFTSPISSPNLFFFFFFAFLKKNFSFVKFYVGPKRFSLVRP